MRHRGHGCFSSESSETCWAVMKCSCVEGAGWAPTTVPVARRLLQELSVGAFAFLICQYSYAGWEYCSVALGLLSLALTQNVSPMASCSCSSFFLALGVGACILREKIPCYCF